MPRLDNTKNITKRNAHAIIAKALRAYFEGDERYDSYGAIIVATRKYY